MFKIHTLIVVLPGYQATFAVLLDREQVLLTFDAVQRLASGVRDGPLLLRLLALLLGGAPFLLAVTDLHVRVDWVLHLVRPKQARVVLGQIFLLPVGDLAAHDEPGAELDGLRVDKAGARGTIVSGLLAGKLYRGRRRLVALRDQRISILVVVMAHARLELHCLLS
jgi:hypothetical protein